MDTCKLVALAVVACGLAGMAPGAQKKKKEVTQTLQLPKELPASATGETRRLTFHVTPLSGKGLLSAQVREALKVLVRDTGGGPVLRIRAFVAGSGDLRRVRDLVSDTFDDRKQPLPALSLVQSGGLPMEGAQVVLEAVAVTKKEVNPNGLVFAPAAVITTENPLDSPAPLAEKSLTELKANLKAAGSEAADVLRVTCFLSNLDSVAATRQLVEAEYPKAAMNFVQTQRAPGRATGACEAVARLTWRTGKRIHYVPVEGSPKAALVSSAKVTFSGTQVSYGYEEADSKLAFERLMKSLESAGVTRADIAVAQYYALGEPIAVQIRKLAPGFFGNPASGILLMEGLPSMQAGFAVDVVAARD
jgi:enamine deaminase RidA (YjgF/YER057c/UK114 family)